MYDIQVPNPLGLRVASVDIIYKYVYMMNVSTEIYLDRGAP